MHTKKGKSKGKGRTEFADEGSFVVNEDNKVVVEEYRIIYNRVKYNHAGMNLDEIYEKTTINKDIKKSNGKNSDINKNSNSSNTANTKKKSTNKTITPKKSKNKTITPKNKKDVNKKESSIFKPICRVQLICSKSRPCTYLAYDKRDNEDTVYFVKGPYKNKESINIPILLSEIKKECCEELPTMDYKIEELLPDLFPDIPMGIRKTIDRSKIAYFLVTRSLLQGDIPTVKKSSKLWTLEDVIDWNKVDMVTTYTYSKDNNSYIKEYSLGLIWRHIIGIPDPADRNFIIDVNGSFYSVDEENINHPTEYSNTLKGGRKESVRKYIEDNWASLNRTLEEWENNLEKCKLIQRVDMLPILDRLSKFIENHKYRNMLFM